MIISKEYKQNYNVAKYKYNMLSWKFLKQIMMTEPLYLMDIMDKCCQIFLDKDATEASKDFNIKILSDMKGPETTNIDFITQRQKNLVFVYESDTIEVSCNHEPNCQFAVLIKPVVNYQERGNRSGSPSVNYGNTITCYNCEETGQIARNCPKQVCREDNGSDTNQQSQ